MKFDVAIIGGGPAGIAAAKVLEKHNINYCLIDKHVFPREKLCGGGITEEGIEILKELKLYDDSYIKQELSMFNIVIDNIVRKIDVKLITVERSQFDYLNICKLKNNNIFLGEDVTNVDIAAHTITTVKSTYTAKYIIFADGVNGYSSKIYNTKRKNAIAVETNISNTSYDVGTISFDDTKFGYGWIFPKGDYANFGIGKFYKTKDNYKKLLCDFCKKYGYSINSSDIKGYPIPLKVTTKILDDYIIFIGDSGGFVNPITGEGIAYALKSGVISAEVITGKLKNKDIDIQRSYSKLIKKLAFKIRLSSMLSKIFYYGFSSLFIKLAFSNKFTLNIVKKLLF